jgi:hypothetical protein
VIITRRPTVSKNRPSSSGPRKLPIANGTRYHGALAVSTLRILLRTSAKVKKTELYRNAWPMNSERPRTDRLG